MSWQQEAIEAFVAAGIGESEQWYLDVDGDVRMSADTDDYSHPAWLLYLDGSSLRMEWGCITFESDVQVSAVATAQRLLRAAAAWEVTDEP